METLGTVLQISRAAKNLYILSSLRLHARARAYFWRTTSRTSTLTTITSCNSILKSRYWSRISNSIAGYMFSYSLSILFAYTFSRRGWQDSAQTSTKRHPKRTSPIFSCILQITLSTLKTREYSNSIKVLTTQIRVTRERSPRFLNGSKTTSTMASSASRRWCIKSNILSLRPSALCSLV